MIVNCLILQTAKQLHIFKRTTDLLYLYIVLTRFRPWTGVKYFQSNLLEVDKEGM